MKIVFILLFIPLISFSQVTYKDVMSISTKNTFLKVMLDNKYSQMESDSAELVFGLIPSENDTSSSFAYYYSDNRFMFQFVRTGTMYTGTPQEKVVVMDNPYDTIYNKISEKCKLVSIREVDKKNYACYDCKKAKFDGLIGLTTSGQSGFITDFAE